MTTPQEFFGQIGKVLRSHGEHLTREPLPERWVELILYLDEKERQMKVPHSDARRDGSR
jgi:hypothetical protein